MTSASPAAQSLSALLLKHCPVYYFDAQEPIPLTNLDQYTQNGTVNPDRSVTGAVTYSNDTIDLHYFAFYLKDAGLKIIGSWTSGSHPYDIEHLVVQVDRTTAAVTGILYQPHGFAEHFFIKGEADLAQVLVDAARPLVFVSQGKHGQYPTPGTIIRYLGFANDHCNPADPNKPSGTTVHPATSRLLAQSSIDGGKFKGIKNRLEIDYSTIPVVPLSKVKTHMCFKMPKLSS